MIAVFSIVCAFSLVIFIHEFGHFFVAKKCGIGVQEFSIGFGPRIIWFKDRSGVVWKFCLLPLGGFVRFEGDSNPSSIGKSIINGNPPARNFHGAPIWARSLTVLAGPFANILFSVFIFSVLILLNGITSDKPIIGKINIPFYNLNIKEGDTVLSINQTPTHSFSEILRQYQGTDRTEVVELLIKRNEKVFKVNAPNLFQPIVKDVEMLSPASRAGIKVGDLILKVNKEQIFSFSELKNYVVQSSGKPLVLDILRNQREIQKILVPELRPIEDKDGNLVETLRIGIIGGFAFEPERNTPDFFTAFELGLLTTWRVIYQSIRGLSEIIKGSISAKHLTGPVGIAHAITDVSKNGLVPFFSLVALISTGIAVINLFPLPVLDGGHLLLLLYEKFSGRVPSERFMQFFMMFGLALLLSLMLFATYNDLLRIIF